MKRIIVFCMVMVLACTACFALAGCSSLDATQDLDSVLESGVLRVGMEAGYQPFNWTQTTDADGAVAISGMSGYYANGYDVMIAQDIADELGVELEVYALEWDALIGALTAGTIDCIIAGMSPTAERKETIDFTDAYYTSNLVIVVSEDSQLASCTSLAEVVDMDANIVAQRGTFHATALEQICTVTSSMLYETFPLMITALNSNVIDGYIAEEPGAIADCASNEGLTYIALTNNDNGFTASDEDTQIAVGCRMDSSLTDAINDILDNISQDTRDTMMELAISLQSAGD